MATSGRAPVRCCIASGSTRHATLTLGMPSLAQAANMMSLNPDLGESLGKQLCLLCRVS